MTEEYKELSSEEIERVKARLAIAGPPDRSRNATAMDWYALDVGRLIATVAAKEAEIHELEESIAALTSKDVREAFAAAPDPETLHNPDPCANGHDKCYSPNVLASLPPQYPWICRRCGIEGLVRGAYTDHDEYERLRQRKAVPQGEDEKP